MRALKPRRGPDEFGDFQTPLPLAAEVCALLSGRGIVPATIVEPTCGLGHFVLSALDLFPAAGYLAAEINASYIGALAVSLRSRGDTATVRILQQSCFDIDWAATFRDLPEPILVLGNPPWVTNARLGSLGSTNLPAKTNFQRHSGLDAVTGKSNFDVSEWVLIRLLESLAGRRAWLAMLCKTIVARKVLLHAWKNGMALDGVEMRAIDAPAVFGAAVDACLLMCTLSATGTTTECHIYPDLWSPHPSSLIGWRDGQLLADASAYERWKHLVGGGPYTWRSGIKHDCSNVMELRKDIRSFRNGLGELVELEDEYLFPMLKSSDLANGPVADPVRWMLVPQRKVGDDTQAIARKAPKTWQYLLRHGEALDRRGSSIYRNRARFAVFGVGDYTFAPWKVAISGFYKRLTFSVVGNLEGKPTVLDDTCYFIPCQSEQEARFVASLLDSEIAREFFSAFIFWDAKRPITVELLRKLDLLALAREMGLEDRLRLFLAIRPDSKRMQCELFGSP
jgi:hypothetical protein